MNGQTQVSFNKQTNQVKCFGSLILKDLDVLKKIPNAEVGITITTPDDIVHHVGKQKLVE